MCRSVKVTSKSREAVRTLVEKTIAARDYEAKVNRDLGNRIKDDDFKVQSYLDGEKSVDFYRMPIDMGFATLPRAINDSKVTSLINYMTNESRGDYAWSGRMDEIPADAKMRELLPSLARYEELGKELQKLFDEEITVRFLDEFMGSLNRKSCFMARKTWTDGELKWQIPMSCRNGVRQRVTWLASWTPCMTTKSFYCGRAE